MTLSADIPTTLNYASLADALRAVDPSVVMMPSWLLDSVIAADRDIRGPRFSIPHDRSHVIDRARLMQLASDEDLPLEADPPAEQVLILIPRPDADWLSSTPAPDVLLKMWRTLFHAATDGAFRAKRMSVEFDESAVQRRIERIGRPAFREAVYVLQKERELATWADDAEAYSEFAATYLELLHFEPWLLHWYFPAADGERVAPALAEEFDVSELLARTRPADAAEPAVAPVDLFDDSPSDLPDDEPAPTKSEPDKREGKRLIARALSAEERGNDVAAALLRTRAARVSRGDAGKLRSGAARRIDAVASRLRIAFDLDEADFDPWRAVLRALLARAGNGWWNNERRLLYDLQKACICHEREAYSANVVEWLLDRCKRPLRRPQPAQRLVTAHKSLRSAEHRAHKARLNPHDRAALLRLLHSAVEHASTRIRTDLRPAMLQAIEEGDLRPQSAVEIVAEEKLVDELLDGVVRRGYLNLGNLRDAVSRSQLKLDDLSGPRELLGRDQLLRADRKLEFALDGVYHRGEIYLRIFQRLSAVLFGTHYGRLMTRGLLIPAIGAFIVLEGTDHSVGVLIHKLTDRHVHFTHPLTLVLLALLIMGLVNWPAFRAAAGRAGRMLGSGLKTVFIELPRRLGSLPVFRLLFKSQLARLLFRYAVKPLAITAIAWLLIPGDTLPGPRAAVLVAVYLASTLLLNSAAGRRFEQTLFHALRVTVPRFTWDILTGIFRLVMYVFGRFLESVDRALYAVDEWLRFGATHNRFAIAGKAALGVVWFFIAYVTRFVVNLLVEPQINPIKHFPVVTVSHKIILPTGYPMAKAFETLGVESVRAGTLAGTIVTSIPGIFGFLAWELKENWKLYRRNRPATLRPVNVGSHGETFAQLLRPGFHSGTLPKLFARVRKSVSRRRNRAGGISQREQHAAQHVREDVAAFVDRELVNLLNRHPEFATLPISVGEIELAATRVRVELRCDHSPAGPAFLAFDQNDSFVLASIEEPGWMVGLSVCQAELLRVALIGFYKLAAVDLCAEQIRSAFSPALTHLDVRRGQLVVWTGDGFDNSTTYPLVPPTAETQALMLRHVDVPWPVWKRVWDARETSVILEMTGQIAPGVEALPALCKRTEDRVGEATGGFPVITISIPDVADYPSAEAPVI